MEMRYIFILFALIVTSTHVIGQSAGEYKSFSKKDAEKFKSAKNEHKRKNVDSALKQYCKLLNKYEGHPDLELWVGLAYKDMEKYDLAIPHLVKATNSNQSSNAQLYSTIGELYRNKKNYAQAKSYYELFLEKIEKNSRLYPQGKKLYDQMAFAANQVENPVPFNPTPLALGVNTLESEYLPQFTADQSTLYFTRVSRGQEDIYFTSYDGANYTEPQTFDIVHVATKNEGAHTISADGNRFFFTLCDDKSGQGGCDIYYTTRENGEWKKPKNMGGRINSILWESQPSLAGDGNTLFFSSTRDGGLGGKDIWYCELDAQGFWSDPINAGHNINTSGDESSPFIHPDSRTLYFRSDDHIGMGSYDIFISRKKQSGEWTKALNMGYPINTDGQEGALSVSLSGNKAYYATDFDGESVRNNLDIYEFDLPLHLRPIPCTYLKTKSIDIGTKIPVVTNLEIVDINTGENVLSKRSDINGEILIPIPLSKELLINVEAEGYILFSDNIILDTIVHGLDPYLKLIELEKIEVTAEPKSFVLRNVLFETATAELKSISYTEIEKLEKILSTNTYQLRIEGHTDDVGSESDNINLSRQRAEAVKAALVKLSVNPSRIITIGKGESVPIADNTTEEGRRINRRTEFFLY